MDRSRSRFVLASLLVAAVLAVTLSAAPTSSARPAGSSTTSPPEHVPGQVIVRFKAGTSVSEMARAQRDVSAAEVASGLPRTRVLKVPAQRTESVLEALRRNPNVEMVEQDAVIHVAETPTDPEWSRQWSNSKLRAPQAWDTTKGSSSVVIAVLDSGYTASLPEVQGKFVPGYDFVNNDADPTDDHGHGTQVVGIMAASMNNGAGLAGWCPNCRYMPVKVATASGTGTHSAVASGLRWAADHGARIMNLSLTSTTSSTTLRDAVLYARSKGAIVIAGAGNDACDCLRYPAAYDEVVSVGASTSRDERYSYTNYGSWVDVAAPGQNVATQMSGTYYLFGGTSSATPVVAGVAGLLWSAAPNAAAAQIEQALMNGVVSVGTWVAHGRIDAVSALAVAMGSPAPTTTTTAAPTTTTTAAPTTTTTAPTTTTTTAPPAPSSSPGTETWTFSGSLTNKVKTAEHAVTTSSGTLDATLTFGGKRGSSFTIEVVSPSGSILARSTGGSPLTITATVTGGDHQLRVLSGSGGYTLDVSNTAG